MNCREFVKSSDSFYFIPSYSVFELFELISESKIRPCGNEGSNFCDFSSDPKKKVPANKKLPQAFFSEKNTPK